MHGECYRKGNGQPYTRKQYIKGKPQIKIAKFQSGSTDRLQKYDYSVQLLINERLQITHMAIEATRLAANKKQPEKLVIFQNLEYILTSCFGRTR